MRFLDFERNARAVWDEIPERFKQGVDGLVVDRSTQRHPEYADLFTLGECVTEDYPSQYGGPDTIRSAVVLYYGSFRQLAREDESFDWEVEIHDTIMHELQHHLETLATEDALEDFDYAVDENYKRTAGEPFDPLFYRAGVPDLASTTGTPSAFRVEGDVFVEVRTRERSASRFAFEWEGVRYALELAEAESDVTFIYVDDVPVNGEGDFCVVRVIERGFVATLMGALGGGMTVSETTAVAEIVA